MPDMRASAMTIAFQATLITITAALAVWAWQTR